MIDGHGGRQSAEFVKQNLAKELAIQLEKCNIEVNQQLKSNLEFEPSPGNRIDRIVRMALVRACHRIDQQISIDLHSCIGTYLIEKIDGCCIVCVLIGDKIVYSANVGDSIAYLHRYMNNEYISI